jgi:predicted metal-dependent phosphoesterase TrpH
VIDLHLHTTASDGRCEPRDIAAVARRARLRTISVTDHDTVSALDEVAAGCAVEGLELVPGIEITAIEDDEDVHVLGYFFDPRHPVLASFLASQLADRRRRFREMAVRLAELGLAVDAEAALAGHEDDASVGRPLLARAMVRAGHVRTTREAFDLYLADHRPAWLPRRAPSPAEVVALLHQAGGIAAAAHPALLGHDEWLPPLAAAGLDAIEAYYSDHSPEMTRHYRELAQRLGIGASGGSDYHGDPTHGPERPGACGLPEEAFADLRRRAAARRQTL